MNFCTICGDSCGIATKHPECETQLNLGVPPEKVRAEIKLARGRKRNAAVYSSAARLPVLAGILFPLFICGGAIDGYSVARTDDITLALFFAVIGGAIGGVVGALIFTWFRMQALLAHRIVEYLDSH